MIAVALVLLLSLLANAMLFYAYYVRNRDSIIAQDKICKTLCAVQAELASVRVKHGQTWEVFMPLMETFEKQIGPKEYAVFLGQPIDLIYFKPDEIVFVEVKTGNSRLSSRQRTVRDLVKGGKVKWVEINDTLQPVSPGTDRISSAAIMKTIPHRKPPEENSNG